MLVVDCHFKLEGHVQFDKTEREAHFQFAALMRGWRAVRRKF